MKTITTQPVNQQRSRLPGIPNRLFSMEDKRKSTSKIIEKSINSHQSTTAKA
jgi:hypothetical protein